MSDFSETLEYFENTWIKTKTDSSGKKHILLSETKEGLDNDNFKTQNPPIVSHEHYIWEDDKFILQVRTTDKSLNAVDTKGHLLKKEGGGEVINLNDEMSKELESFFNYAETKTDLHYLKKDILQSIALNKSTKNMANKDEFEKQRDLLIDFKQYQQNFADKFRELLKHYKDTIQDFEDDGLTKNYVDALNIDYNELDNQHIKQICNEIEVEDMKHTQNMIDDLEEMIDKSKKIR